MKKILLDFVLLVCCFSLCAKGIRVNVQPGEHWKEKRNPQVAIWLEDESGSFIRTLYVTDRAEKKNWIFAPKAGRPESLPVYYHASNSGASQKCDVVSSATPKSGFGFDGNLDDGRSYVVKAEFNNSYDYNDFYTKKNSGVNGQPSVVYLARIPAGFKGVLQLEFVGNGSLDGSDGLVHKAEGLTTAKEIVESVTVVVE